MSENQGVILTISVVVLVCVIALVGVVYAFIQTLKSLQFNGTMSALEPDREVTLLQTKNNFNFAIPKAEVKQEPPKIETTPTNTTDSKNSDTKTQEANTSDTGDKKDSNKKEYNYNFPIPEAEVNLPQIKNIQIPSINYNSPVIISNDGDSAIDYGAWFYPSGHPLAGESIFLCHRRYFKSSDPKSCWNLDKVKTNADLYITFADGSQANYKIDTISVAKGTDMNVYNTSQDKKIKLISCSKQNGKIGSADYRIVVIASLVSYNK